MSASAPIVYVVDDDMSCLTAVSRLLKAAGFMVQTFTTAASFLEQLSPSTRGCVMVDLAMPEMGGLDLQAEVLRRGHKIPVVFLTGHSDIQKSVQAIKLGAEDFLIKPSSRKELVDAVSRALMRDARQETERAQIDELRAPFNTLTSREREVLAHVLQGQLNKQIASDLCIDERSVKRHRASIMAKLRVQSVAQLTHLVDGAGLWSVSKDMASKELSPVARM